MAQTEARLKMSNGVRYTPTFAMPSEYERQAMEARRRRRMAEMLAAQAYQPQEGGVAPIPTAAPLVQGLQAFLTARQLRKAEEAEEKASQTESEYAKRISGRLAGGYVPDFNVPAAEVPEQTELGEVTLTSQKRPAETLQQYQDRMRSAQFTNPSYDQMLARTPEQTTLEPIVPTARYKKSPEEALAMAETDVGMAAMKNRPVLAARLAKLLETPESKTMEFDGKLLNVSGGQATPVMMGGQAVTASTAAEAPKVHGNLQWNATTGKWEKIPDYQPGGGTNVTVKVPGDKTRDVYSEKLSEGLAGQDLAVIEAGNQAIPRIEMSYNVRDLLAQNPITGFAAEQRLGFEKALAAAGFVKGDRASITENLSATLAKTTLGVIRTSGLGSGQGFTDKDRDFLERAAAGKIELTSENLNYLAELNEKAARYDIMRSNQVRSRIRQMPNFQQMPGALPDIVAPEPYSTRGFRVTRPGQ